MSSFFGSFLTAVLLVAWLPATARAAGPQGTAPSPSPSAGPEEADVKKIQEKYWARGNEAEVGVVQNRLFTKRRKIELGLNLGNIFGDPFLTDTALALNVGYHFTEILSAHLEFAKTFVGPSSALTTLQRTEATTANTNQPKFYLMGEGRASLLYGKVSLLGKAILYFDAYLTGGLGFINTESGTDPMVDFGVGQLLHINQTFGLTISYKFLWYRETILGKIAPNNGNPGNLGQNMGVHSNLSSEILVGVTILLDPFPKEKPAK